MYFFSKIIITIIVVVITATIRVEITINSIMGILQDSTNSNHNNIDKENHSNNNDNININHKFYSANNDCFVYMNDKDENRNFKVEQICIFSCNFCLKWHSCFQHPCYSYHYYFQYICINNFQYHIWSCVITFIMFVVSVASIILSLVDG